MQHGKITCVLTGMCFMCCPVNVPTRRDVKYFSLTLDCSEVQYSQVLSSFEMKHGEPFAATGSTIAVCTWALRSAYSLWQVINYVRPNSDIFHVLSDVLSIYA